MTAQSPPEPPYRPAAQAVPGAQPTAASSGASFQSASSGPAISERPELKIAATFLGGALAATILKRLAR